MNGLLVFFVVWTLVSLPLAVAFGRMLERGRTRRRPIRCRFCQSPATVIGGDLPATCPQHFHHRRHLRGSNR